MILSQLRSWSHSQDFVHVSSKENNFGLYQALSWLVAAKASIIDEYKPVSQNSPVKPVGQVQKADWMSSLHVPLLWHVTLTQSSISVTQCCKCFSLEGPCQSTFLCGWNESFCVSVFVYAPIFITKEKSFCVCECQKLYSKLSKRTKCFFNPLSLLTQKVNFHILGLLIL